MFKVHILSICSHCNGEAYVPVGEQRSGHQWGSRSRLSGCTPPRWRDYRRSQNLQRRGGGHLAAASLYGGSGR